MRSSRSEIREGDVSRRGFLARSGAIAGAVLAARALQAGGEDDKDKKDKKDDKPTSRDASGRKFTIDFVPGRIGIHADQDAAIELAAAHGFESVSALWADLARLDDDGAKKLKERIEEKKLVFGAADLPVNFRDEEGRFRKDMLDLPRFAAALEKFGVKRAGTWIRPSEDSRTYLDNFRTHARRLKEVAKVLGEKGVRLGLEYVGPKRSWSHAHHPFIHTLPETRELIEWIDEKNVGVVLDSWHWYHAGESAEDILRLHGDDVIAVDLNDAPSGIERDQMVDLERRLPASTGVIDVRSFLDALVRIGYEGPVRAEPFDRELNELPAGEAAARTAEAMRRAFALLLPEKEGEEKNTAKS